MDGKFTSHGVSFYWQLGQDTDVVPEPGWTLCVVSGGFSVARRYADSISRDEVEREVEKIAPPILNLIERWLA